MSYKKYPKKINIRSCSPFDSPCKGVVFYTFREDISSFLNVLIRYLVEKEELEAHVEANDINTFGIRQQFRTLNKFELCLFSSGVRIILYYNRTQREGGRSGTFPPGLVDCKGAQCFHCRI